MKILEALNIGETTAKKIKWALRNGLTALRDDGSAYARDEDGEDYEVIFGVVYMGMYMLVGERNYYNAKKFADMHKGACVISYAQ